MMESKSCPFCGGSIDSHSENCYIYLLEEQVKGMYSPLHTYIDPRIMDEAWNTRYEPTCKWVPNYQIDGGGCTYDTDCAATVIWEGSLPPKCMFCGGKVIEE